ncbi:hypothetical protein [Enterobacter asburiae]
MSKNNTPVARGRLAQNLVGCTVLPNRPLPADADLFAVADNCPALVPQELSMVQSQRPPFSCRKNKFRPGNPLENNYMQLTSFIGHKTTPIFQHVSLILLVLTYIYK